MTKPTLVALAAALALGATWTTARADGVFVKFHGQQSGVISGPYINEQHKGVSFREVASEATGTRSFEITFEWDNAIALLANSLVNGENYTVNLDFYRRMTQPRMTVNGAISDTIYAKLELVGAKLSRLLVVYGGSTSHRTAIYLARLMVPAQDVKIQAVPAPTTSTAPPTGGRPAVVSMVLAPAIPTIAASSGTFGVDLLNGNDVRGADGGTVDVQPTSGSFHAELQHPGGTTTSSVDSFVLDISAPSGHATFQPVIIAKTPGASSPDFAQAQATGASLNRIEIVLSAPTHPGGMPVAQFQLKLATAKITSNQTSSDAHAHQTETIGMSGQQVELNDLISHVTMQAPWH
ncbi:MAG TPA: type VI secretion system tube protein Hcp [Gemmatimonadales bacterium]|jgi:type VI protein secretion system component Hcp